MSAINLQINFVDGTTTEASAIAIDQIKFESHFNLSMAKLQTDMMLTHLYWLAWHTQQRTGVTKDDFEPWAEKVESIEAVEIKK
jgi:hypothetical protein